MDRFTDEARLSFLKICKYSQTSTDIGNYQSIPRPYYSFGFIEKGCGEFFFDDKSITVKKGDIIFVPMNSTYISKWNKADFSEYISAHFQFDIPSPFYRHYKFSIQKISVENYDELKNMFEHLYDTYNNAEKSKANQFSVLGMFYNIMGRIYPHLEFTRIGRIDDRIRRAVDYIENNYTEDFSVAYLAEICDMSISHFHYCFKKELGISAIDYKHRVCIRNASLMLIENKKSIEEISEAVGFKSSIYFREIFKKIMGISPREYKKTEEISS